MRISKELLMHYLLNGNDEVSFNDSIIINTGIYCNDNDETYFIEIKGCIYYGKEVLNEFNQYERDLIREELESVNLVDVDDDIIQEFDINDKDIYEIAVILLNNHNFVQYKD